MKDYSTVGIAGAFGGIRVEVFTLLMIGLMVWIVMNRDKVNETIKDLAQRHHPAF